MLWNNFYIKKDATSSCNKLLLLFALFSFIFSCSTSSEPEPKSTPAKVESENKKSQSNSEETVKEGEAKNSSKNAITRGNPVFLTTTFNNESLFEGSIDEGIASETMLALDEITARETSNSSLLVTYMGLLRLTGKNPELAKDLERKAGIADPKNPWFGIEGAYSAIKRRDYSMADFLLERSLKFGKENASIKAVVNHAYAIRYLHEGKMQKAIERLKRGADATPPFLPALMTLGVLGLKSGDYEGALKLFRIASGLAGNSYNIKICLAAVMRAKGRADEAITILKPMHASNKNDRRIVFNYALSLFDAGGEGNIKKASELLTGYFQLPGSYPELDNKANTLMNKINQVAPAEQKPPSD